MLLFSMETHEISLNMKYRKITGHAEIVRVGNNDFD